MNTGTLFLPSLEGKRFIKIEAVSQTEAIKFCEEFTKRVLDTRKLKNEDAPEQADIIFYNNVLDANRVDDTENETNEEYKTFYVKMLADALLLSNNKGVRGARALYVAYNEEKCFGDTMDEASVVFGVGTTVIYNQNWATINYADDTIASIVEALHTWPLEEEEEDEDEESADFPGSWSW